MEQEFDKVKNDFDQLGFCLQTFKDYILVTLLINNVPLYDQIVFHHAIHSYETEDERAAYFLKSYSFNIYPTEYTVSEKELYLFNALEGLSPVDYKHDMIGLDVYTTFQILYLPFLFTNELEFTVSEKWDIDSSRSELGYLGGYYCLMHNCGCQGCSDMLFNFDRDETEHTIRFHSFQFNSGWKFHSNVEFTFDEIQYLEVVRRIKSIYDNLKTEEDWLKYKESQNNE